MYATWGEVSSYVKQKISMAKFECLRCCIADFEIFEINRKKAFM